MCHSRGNPDLFDARQCWGGVDAAAHHHHPGPARCPPAPIGLAEFHLQKLLRSFGHPLTRIALTNLAQHYQHGRGGGAATGHADPGVCAGGPYAWAANVTLSSPCQCLTELPLPSWAGLHSFGRAKDHQNCFSDCKKFCVILKPCCVIFCKSKDDRKDWILWGWWEDLRQLLLTTMCQWCTKALVVLFL